MIRNFPTRFAYFLLYLLLTIVTMGIYPAYYFFSRTDEKLDLLRQIAQNTKQV